MNAPQQTITALYDEVDRRYTEALYAIYESRRSAEARLELLKRLQNGHATAPTAAAQLESIKAVMEELGG
jgi:hypothetical protein